ncbi:hypothetical protein CTAM01_00930 [Colletotrichum tamarilloi]|uniref:Uncharacterized protein n=1 Tax=Colletotrichum tamarilloi TaxID=1209934 RepID=A0ABQ9RTC8_9PEZI|nr:uncharacterized protein CTAM01_00930 [Colletotrichum tamarilloi]KAK1512000.1 hypothetical protein CTAM01_00930 [Colletotrichum tamarilloi]
MNQPIPIFDSISSSDPKYTDEIRMNREDSAANLKVSSQKHVMLRACAALSEQMNTLWTDETVAKFGTYISSGLSHDNEGWKA